MVDPKSFDSDDGFEDALRAVLTEAADNGVTIEGGWKVTTTHNNHSHWDVQITAVEYDEAEEE